jgi:mono/diheme cytochrome c family protein
MLFGCRVQSLVPVVLLAAACTQVPAEPKPTDPAITSATPQNPVDRGRYLVTIGACHDCHTPKTFTAPEPQPDMSRALSGHPASEKIGSIPAGLIAPDKWGAVTNNHLTAWAGPWGVSFARNLTPDMATGLGSWTEEMFIKAIRLGKHQGEGRPILPPMPWPMYREMTDEDLKAVFAYLRTLPPIQNAVPDPVPPEKLTQ